MEDNRRLRDMIKSCGKEMEPDQERKREALYAVRRAAKQKKVRYCPKAGRRLMIQLSGISMKFICSQLLFLFALPGCEYVLFHYTGIKGRHIFPFLSVLMSAGGVVLVTELAAHYSCHMAELEQSCYLNLSQLWLLRSMLAAAMDIVAVALLAVFRAGDYGFGWFPFLVYVLTPFFIADAVLFAVICAGRKGGRGLLLIAAAGIAGMSFAFQTVLPFLYEAVWLPLWILVFAGAFFASFAEIKHVYRTLEERGEQICWS